MSLHHAERPTRQSARPAPAVGAGWPLPAARLLATIRIAMGLVFAWAFLDKSFGLGYATPSANAWINGGSPTKGFLGGIDRGPLGDMFRSWAGQAWADWLFMAGLLGIGVALLLGVGLRVAAVAGSVQMALMWAAEWPLARHTDVGELTRSTNPVLDYHIVYALVLVLLAAACAGDVWGMGRRWARLDLVDRNRWLR
ncbi:MULTISPECIES: DoxX family membrane protein [Actinokineospora]|uniref:Membrane protein n=1 Tax=Actinokineospora fastidiosa TaxID=1816 RepID=A0A918GBZ8_9PSEU|nr:MULTISPECIES: DoxX family membrane protein [Actinokineospora]UVS79455.1 DoxX [Actinokineospora sp. UTMC 2448]GGS28379.1 membrane protein [Actinokineospora fastidiosa]